MPRDDEPIPATLNLRCIECGYELTGLVERRCPECGERFDPRDTWLANERGTWEYHFENVHSKWEYAGLVYVGVAGVTFLVLCGVRRLALLGIPMAVMGELCVYYLGGSGLVARVIYMTVCLLIGVVAVVLT